MTGSLLFGSPQTRTGLFLFGVALTQRFDGFDDIPVSGRRTSVHPQNIHAHLLVTLNICFSSDIIQSVLIITTHGFLFGRNRSVFCQCRQCLIPPGNLVWIVLIVVYLYYCLVVESFLSSGRSSAIDQARLLLLLLPTSRNGFTPSIGLEV